MHYVRVVLTGKDIARTTHIGGQLVYFVESMVDNVSAEILIAQIADNKVVGSRFGEFRVLEIYASYPKTFILQSPDKMRSNKASGAENQSSRHFVLRYNHPLEYRRPLSHKRRSTYCMLWI